MPFSNPQWTFERIQFLRKVDLVSVLSGLLYRNEWSSINGIFIYVVYIIGISILFIILFQSIRQVSMKEFFIQVMKERFIGSIKKIFLNSHSQQVWSMYGILFISNIKNVLCLIWENIKEGIYSKENKFLSFLFDTKRFQKL